MLGAAPPAGKTTGRYEIRREIQGHEMQEAVTRTSGREIGLLNLRIPLGDFARGGRGETVRVTHSWIRPRRIPGLLEADTPHLRRLLQRAIDKSR